MKKYFVSVALVGAFSVTMMNATIGSGDDSNGAFVGLNLGGMISGQLSGGVALNSAVAVGLKGGYQAFFYDRVGARFYLSGIGAFGLVGVPSAASSKPDMSINLNIMTDLNGDMLFDFISDGDFTAGMYTGFFGGALISTPIKKITGNPTKTMVGTTVGLNIGSRTTIMTHHEFDIGAKIGVAFNNDGSKSSVGAAIYVGSSYSYKF